MQKIKLNYRNRKLWLTHGLKKSIKTKNKLYVKSIKTPTLHNIKIYKEYRNKLNSLLRKAERLHYDQLFVKNKNNLKKSWAIIKQVINKRKNQIVFSKFKINNNIVTDEKIIANNFNKYFVNLGPSLAKNIPLYQTNPTSYIKQSSPDSMFITPVTNEELVNIVMALKSSSPGWDGLTADIIKSNINLFIQPLIHICNLSFSNGVFPAELKVAKVMPMYKTGDKMTLNNYRPISTLPIFSKILERLMYNRLLSYINKNNILYSHQFGFRTNHGTDLALISLVDYISNALNQGELVCGVFLDFSKAFDTINHKILLNKLYKYGIRGIVLNWFDDYLSQREQYVTINEINSDKCKITCGVPQGSVLGPLLFLLYVNDLANVSKLLFPILFADDTSVFLSDKNINTLISTVNQELEKIIDWLCINRLSLI